MPHRPLALALALVVPACGSDSPPTGPITATAQRYDFSFDLASRAARATVTLRVDTGGDCLSLPFRAAAPANLHLGGAPANGTLVDNVLTACGGGWDRGEILELSLDAEVPLATLEDSQVGYSVTTDRDGNDLHYLVSWVGGCDRFLPCDNRPDRFARYRLSITHPAEVVVLCSGALATGDTVTTCDFDLPGGPTYSTFGMVATSGWSVVDKGTWGATQVTVYDRPSTGLAALVDPDYHAGFLAMMESRFGAYPYGSELRIASAPTYWSGFEHPGNIVLNEDLARPLGWSYARPVPHVLNHEIAHQWAGDETTLAETYDFVWKEAMAEYLTFVYEAETEPAIGLHTANVWKNFADGALYFPVPEERPPLFDYYGEVYGPGPMILFRQLEALTSRDQVLTAIASLLGNEATRSIDDVRVALEAATGLDLVDYFDAWVYGRGAPIWPVFTATVAQSPLRLEVAQANVATAGAKPCAFDVELRGAGAGEATRVAVDTFRNGDRQTIAITDPGFTITSVLVDPDAECLAFVPGARARRHPIGWSPWRAPR